MSTAISYRALTAAMFIATGRVPAGSHPGHAEGIAEGTLLLIAERIDRAIESAITNTKRVERDIREFNDRDFRPWSSAIVSVNTSADLAAASTRIEVLAELFDDLFGTMVKHTSGATMSARVAQVVIRDNVSTIPSLDDQPWASRSGDFGREAAGALALAIAFSAQHAEYRTRVAAEEKAAAEAEAAAKLAAKEAAKAAAKEERAQERAARRNASSKAQVSS